MATRADPIASAEPGVQTAVQREIRAFARDSGPVEREPRERLAEASAERGEDSIALRADPVLEIRTLAIVRSRSRRSARVGLVVPDPRSTARCAASAGSRVLARTAAGHAARSSMARARIATQRVRR